MSDGHDEFDRLNAMIEPGQQTWDLSPNDMKAIRCVLDTCKRQAEKLARILTWCNSQLSRPSAMSADDGRRQACGYIKAIIEAEVKP